MTIHTTIESPASARAAEPTLDQRLRFIDLTFECVHRATKIDERFNGVTPKAYQHEMPSPRGKRIGAIANRLREKSCEREGLPIDVLLGRHPLQSLAVRAIGAGRIAA